MAQAPDPITSPPPTAAQPYDATSDANVGKWVSVNPKSGPADSSGNATGEFPGDGPWKQT